VERVGGARLKDRMRALQHTTEGGGGRNIEVHIRALINKERSFEKKTNELKPKSAEKGRMKELLERGWSEINNARRGCGAAGGRVVEGGDPSGT